MSEEEWLAGEIEADEDIAAGRLNLVESAEEMDEVLDQIARGEYS